MKTIYIFLFATFIYFLTIGKLTAQETKPVQSNYTYSNAIGLRLGGTSGLTFKHNFGNRSAVELILGAFPRSYGFTALYERISPTSVNGLRFYYGIGGHISGAYYRSWYYYNTDNSRYAYYRTYGYGPILGIDLIGGLEYKFPTIPLALSFDLKPFAEFYNMYGPFFGLDPSIGVKVAF
jgi:hypothetical protein